MTKWYPCPGAGLFHLGPIIIQTTESPSPSQTSEFVQGLGCATTHLIAGVL